VGGLAFGLAGGLAVGTAVGLTVGPLAGLAVGLLFSLLGGLTIGLTFGTALWCAGSAWYAFVVAALARTVRLRRSLPAPWRLMSVMQDCHRLGLLRAVGPVYQFRHAELQDHLAPPLLRRKTGDGTQPQPANLPAPAGTAGPE
jgi:hypothetical protein